MPCTSYPVELIGIKHRNLRHLLSLSIIAAKQTSNIPISFGANEASEAMGWIGPNIQEPHLDGWAQRGRRRGAQFSDDG